MYLFPFVPENLYISFSRAFYEVGAFVPGTFWTWSLLHFHLLNLTVAF